MTSAKWSLSLFENVSLALLPASWLPLKSQTLSLQALLRHYGCVTWGITLVYTVCKPLPAVFAKITHRRRSKRSRPCWYRGPGSMDFCSLLQEGQRSNRPAQNLQILRSCAHAAASANRCTQRRHRTSDVVVCLRHREWDGRSPCLNKKKLIKRLKNCQRWHSRPHPPPRVTGWKKGSCPLECE